MLSVLAVLCQNDMVNFKGTIKMLTEIKYGNTSTFLISGTKSNILIDTDYAGTMPAFYKAIKDKGIKVSDIKYVLATHYHPDHMGLISELMDQGVRLLIMESQIPYVHFSDHIFERELHLNYKPIDESRAQVLKFDEVPSFMNDSIGVEGDILPATSHSEDSVVIALDNHKTFIAGDLEPLEYLDAYQDNEALKDDWNRILSFDPECVYYSHAGRHFFS